MAAPAAMGGSAAGAAQKRGVRVTIDPDELLVDPGGQVTTKVTVRNLGTRVEEFELVLQGPGAAFATISPATVSVYPDVEQRAVVRFAPPRSPDSVAGVSTFEVLSRSLVHSDVIDIARGRLTLGAFENLQAVLLPDVSRGRKSARHQVTVTNGGNTPANAHVAFTDQGKVLTFEPRDKQLSLQPGNIADVPVMLNGPRKWFGRTEQLPFSAVVTPAGTQPPITLNGVRQQTAIFPWWMPPGALVLVGLLIALAALLKPGTPTVPVIGPVDQVAAVKQLTDASYLPDPIPRGDDKVPKGSAISTDPAGGSPLKHGEHVKLYISSGPCGGGPCPVEVPIVEGLPVSEAQAKLEQAQFIVQIIQAPSTDRPVDRVISSDPKATTMRPPHTPVQLTVSSGPPTNPAEQAAAAAAAASAAAAEKAAADKAAADKAAADKAAADKAAADKAAADKAAADKAAADAAAANKPPVPDLTARSVDDATKALTDLGLKAKTAPAPVHSNAVPNGAVLSSDPAAGTKADPGSDVTLTLAQNTALVNLIDTADSTDKAAWNATGMSTTEKLTFGTAGTTGGKVNKLASAPLSGTGTVTTVLETLPPDSGVITGEYKLDTPVVSGDHVKAIVGLINTSTTASSAAGASNTNQITFSVVANGQSIKSVTVQPGTPQQFDADLSGVKDATSIKIVVTSSGKQDPNVTPVWQDLRLEPTVGK